MILETSVTRILGKLNQMNDVYTKRSILIKYYQCQSRLDRKSMRILFSAFFKSYRDASWCLRSLYHRVGDSIVWPPIVHEMSNEPYGKIRIYKIRKCLNVPVIPVFTDHETLGICLSLYDA